MKFDCIEKPMRKIFSKYGKIIATYPILFIVCPVAVALIFCGGFAFLERETDVEYLFAPENTQATKDQERLFKDFESVTKFNAFREIDQVIVAQVIITAKSGGNMWEKHLLDEVFQLDSEITSINATTDDKFIRYQDVCKESSIGTCYDSGLGFLKYTTNITYPTHDLTDPTGGDPFNIFFGHLLGNVTTDQDGTVKDVSAMRVSYFCDDGEDCREWTHAFIQYMLEFENTLIHTEFWTYYSIEFELAENTVRIVPYFSITYTILITFAITACTLNDPVRTKPWLGFCGVISAGLAIATAFGLLMYAGVPFVDLAAASPFLIIGIGIDDMFVMIAAWRKTYHYLSIEGRMAEAFSEAAMSIFITTVTDVLAVGIGAITPFPAVTFFCAYTGLSLAFCFVYQITFFAGCMVMFGKREAGQRHAWTCMKVPAKSEMEEKTGCSYACCAGGISYDHPDDPEDKTEVMIMSFFRDYFGPFINMTWTKVSVFILWGAYIGVAIWGCTILEEGLELKNLAPDDSYVVGFYDQDAQYFSKYSYGVQMVVHTPIDSQQKANQIEDLLDRLESSEYFHGPDVTESWLRDYQNYAEARNYTIDYNDLFSPMFDAFIAEPAYSRYEIDIVESGGERSIFRFLVMSKDIYDANREVNMMKEARDIAAQFPDLDVTAYTYIFIFTEQFVAVLPNTIRNFTIATICMFFIALVLIPHPVVSIWVTFSIVSICVGVIGYMAHWGVRLDTVSMINLIMCIGFCVDFSAHITYAFVTSEHAKRKDRVNDALYALGFPILQGATSTVLGVIVLSVSFAYIFRTFFNIMFLVIVFGTLHGLFLLPVLLSLFGPKGASLVSSLEKIDVGIVEKNTIEMNGHVSEPNETKQHTYDNNGYIKEDLPTSHDL